MHGDFTIDECFALFDRQAKGFVDVYDVQATFDLLGVPNSLTDCEFFIRRHDADKDRVLSVDEFEHAILPVSEEHAYNLRSRNPADLVRVRAHLDRAFSYETCRSMNALFRCYIDVEHALQDLRVRLTHYFPHWGAFELLDKNKDGYVTKVNFKNFVKK